MTQGVCLPPRWVAAPDGIGPLMLPDFGLFDPRFGVGARSYTSAVSNGNRNKRKKPGGQKAAPATTGRTSRPLAWHQFQELNFSFYEEQPSDFINMRVELLSLMLCNEEQLAPAYAAERSIKGVQLGGASPPDAEKRNRYMETEAVIILHHSVEMILRLFYAHVEYKDCPWQGMASEVNFATFKAKVDKSLTEGFDRAVIADIFLGGASPQDAAVAMSAKDFEDAIDGIDLLLQECCRRQLSESFLYNAIKHGLSTIALDEETQFARTLPNGEIVVGHRGPMFAYMHKARRPGPKKDGEREWFITMAGAKTERDLALSLLVANAIESLWDVARRRYTGRGGAIRQIRKSVVETVIYRLLMQSRNVLSTVTMEMPKLKDDGSYDEVHYDFIGPKVPEDIDEQEGPQATDCPRINLVVRQKDKRVFSISQRAFYPFSPKGSQWG
jgi:hypothetical protein